MNISRSGNGANKSLPAPPGLAWVYLYIIFEGKEVKKMGIQNGYRYTRTVVDGVRMLNDFDNRFRFVSQKPFKAKPEKGLEAGTTVTLQILADKSAPIHDKDGRVKENNVFQTFDAMIVGAKYPLPLVKGDFVTLGDFMQDESYFIDFDFVLRFRTIKKLQPMPQTHGQGGKA